MRHPPESRWQQKVFEDVLKERRYQDRQWGQEVDDTLNTPWMWCAYICSYATKWMQNPHRWTREDTEEFYDRMIQTSAIAAAAAESVLRQREPTARPFTKASEMRLSVCAAWVGWIIKCLSWPEREPGAKALIVDCIVRCNINGAMHNWLKRWSAWSDRSRMANNSRATSPRTLSPKQPSTHPRLRTLAHRYRLGRAPCLARIEATEADDKASELIRKEIVPRV